MHTVTSIISKLPHCTREAQPGREHAEPALTVVVVAQGDAPANLVRAHVVCFDMNTAGIIITPLHWEVPPDSGSKLWAPPDQAGWQLMDILNDAGVGQVDFWNRARHSPE